MIPRTSVEVPCAPPSQERLHGKLYARNMLIVVVCREIFGSVGGLKSGCAGVCFLKADSV